jgi:SAM-dependent methyltransferase
MTDQAPGRGGDFYDEGVTGEYLAHRHSGIASPNTVMEQPAFIDAVGDIGDGRVLDLGCGDGSTAPLMLSAGAGTYHGIDGSPQMVARARGGAHDPRVTFEVADIEDFSPEPAAFDLVISRMALHYVADIGPVLRRVRDGLIDGGRLVLTVAHPVLTAHGSESGGQRSSLTVDDYFITGPRPRQWFGRTVTWHHRTVEDYVRAVLDADLQLQRLSECEPDSSLLAEDLAELARRRRVPLMLLLSAVRA